MSIKSVILEEVSLLLEKRIAQITSNFEINFSFDLIKHGKGHANDRSKGIGRGGLGDYDLRPISNLEIKDFVTSLRNEISEKIAYHDIVDGESFVVKSQSKTLAIVLLPKRVGGSYWTLTIKTVWRETPTNIFRVGSDQVVIEVP